MAEELILFEQKGTGAGAKWYVLYEATKTNTPGQTKVTWKLFKGGRNKSPTHLSTTIQFYINGEEVYAPNRFSTEPNSDGTNHPHCSYAASKNETPTTEGEFIVEHDSDGKGSFTMQVNAAIYTKTITYGETQKVELEENYPQTPCYWALGAEVKIEQPYVAPGGVFTISWSGAMPGVDNKIVGYNVYYKVGADDEFIPINSDGVTAENSSLKARLPSNKPRGASIIAKVEIIGEKIKTPVEKTGGSSMVNPELGNLQIVAYTGQETDNTFSYKAPDIKFTYILPAKATPQQIVSKVKINNGAEATLQNNPYVYDLTSSTWDYGETKTFVFWATDGVEDSDKVEIRLTRNVNIENQVSYKIEGYGLEFTIPDGYTAKLKTSQPVALTNGTKIDFRSLCTNLQSGQPFEQEVDLEYTNGGPDTITKEINLEGEVPAFTMSGTVQGLEQYFVGNNYETLAIKDSSDQWSYSGIKEVKPGNTLKQVKMKGSIGNEFYVAVSQDNIVTAIEDLNLKLKLEGDGPYKPYSGNPIFSSGIKTNDWKQYGLNGAPALTFWFEESSKSEYTSSLDLSSDNTIAYQLTRADVYKIAPKSGGNRRLSYSYINAYGIEVTQTSEALFEFDFREQAKRVNSSSPWYICAIPSNKGWDTSYAIENWDCIKEKMPLSTNFEVAATTQPIAWLEREIGKDNWQKFYDFSVQEKKDEEGNVEKNSNLFNTSVTIYTFSQNGEVGQITEGTAGKVRLVVKTDSPDNLTAGYANNLSFSFAYHASPLVKFTDVSYEAPRSESGSGKITAKYEIPSLGSDSNLNLTKTYRCKIENKEELVSQSSIDEGAREVTFSYTIIGTFINIAPDLKTELSATITIDGKEESAFETKYSTLDYEYIVCYNISPTVAYRANHLGINTNAPVEKALLDINAHNDHQLIYLRGTNHLSTIDLATGALINFVFDCGSWDNTPGGIIPSNPDTPTGLARVAYTGQIGDLLQGDYEIIFSGGSSEVENTEQSSEEI